MIHTEIAPTEQADRLAVRELVEWTETRASRP